MSSAEDIGGLGDIPGCRDWGGMEISLGLWAVNCFHCSAPETENPNAFTAYRYRCVFQFVYFQEVWRSALLGRWWMRAPEQSSTMSFVPEQFAPGLQLLLLQSLLEQLSLPEGGRKNSVILSTSEDHACIPKCCPPPPSIWGITSAIPNQPIAMWYRGALFSSPVTSGWSSPGRIV